MFVGGRNKCLLRADVPFALGRITLVFGLFLISPMKLGKALVQPLLGPGGESP